MNQTRILTFVILICAGRFYLFGQDFSDCRFIQEIKLPEPEWNLKIADYIKESSDKYRELTWIECVEFQKTFKKAYENAVTNHEINLTYGLHGDSRIVQDSIIVSKVQDDNRKAHFAAFVIKRSKFDYPLLLSFKELRKSYPENFYFKYLNGDGKNFYFNNREVLQQNEINLQVNHLPILNQAQITTKDEISFSSDTRYQKFLISYDSKSETQFFYLSNENILSGSLNSTLNRLNNYPLEDKSLQKVLKQNQPRFSKVTGLLESELKNYEVLSIDLNEEGVVLNLRDELNILTAIELITHQESSSVLIIKSDELFFTDCINELKYNFETFEIPKGTFINQNLEKELLNHLSKNPKWESYEPLQVIFTEKSKWFEYDHPKAFIRRDMLEASVIYKKKVDGNCFFQKNVGFMRERNTKLGIEVYEIFEAGQPYSKQNIPCITD